MSDRGGSHAALNETGRMHFLKDVELVPMEKDSLCLQSNALVNVANLQGNTALHEAVRGGQQALVELLLRVGASPGLRNKRQRTPLDCAYELGGKVGLQTHYRDRRYRVICLGLKPS